ncbi:hypothetical protein [Bdellovibrio sp. HCB209]|uniref:hypothetical protein n=1 Tax=Bdellovibrio sp. HCB209 TaxID=3394354 RepID=UPI0039B39978
MESRNSMKKLTVIVLQFALILCPVLVDFIGKSAIYLGVGLFVTVALTDFLSKRSSFFEMPNIYLRISPLSLLGVVWVASALQIAGAKDTVFVVYNLIVLLMLSSVSLRKTSEKEATYRESEIFSTMKLTGMIITIIALLIQIVRLKFNT